MSTRYRGDIDNVFLFDALPLEVAWCIIHENRDSLQSKTDGKHLTTWLLMSKKYQNLVYTSICRLGKRPRSGNFNYKPFINLNTIHFRSRELRECTVCDEDLQRFTKLKTLVLGDRNNRITDDTLSKLTNLTSFAYCGSQITDRSISCLTNLKTLALDNNKNITDEGIQKLTNLTALGLDKEESIDGRGFESLTKLESFHLSYHEGWDESFDLTIGKDTFRYLTNITSLDMYANDVIKIGTLAKLPRLKSLSIGYDFMINDDNISQLSNLTSLRVSDCSLNHSGKVIETMTNLVSLEVDFFKHVEKMPHMKVLKDYDYSSFHDFNVVW